MVGNLLLRGILVGVLAGLLAFGFAKIFGEPPIEQAIAFEEQHKEHAQADVHEPGEVHQHGAAQAAEEPELVSRAVQAGIGLATAIIVYGAAVGGLFALVFAFVYGRMGTLGARSTAALLALGAFVTLALVPFIKYPANPPAVGSPDTIGSRTGLFLIMLVVSILAAIAAATVARRLWSALGGWNASLAGGASFVFAIAIAQYALPAVNEVPEQFSASVLWQFRIAVFGMQLILWTTIGLIFGILAERSLEERGVPLKALRQA